ncbi:MAG: hypothetical protein JJ879_01630 [Sneathiella sp.]|nr:hypothetical protein [Sneathiella sp.]
MVSDPLKLSLLPAILLLSACANTSLLEAERAKTDLIGMTKSELYMCAGAPDRETEDEKGGQYAAYDTERITHEPGPYPGPGFYPSFGYGTRGHWFGGYYSYPVTIPKKRQCTATFSFENSRITAVTYRTNDGSEVTSGQCYEIIKNCLSPAPAT